MMLIASFLLCSQSENRSLLTIHNAALDAEQQALRAGIEHVRWLIRDVQIDLAIRRLQRKYEGQPRDEDGRFSFGPLDKSETPAKESAESPNDARPPTGSADPDPGEIVATAKSSILPLDQMVI